MVEENARQKDHNRWARFLSSNVDAKAAYTELQGRVERLAQELATIRARGARVTWIHPSPQPPASEAITAARPLIGRFVRLNSLRDLAAAPLQ